MLAIILRRMIHNDVFSHEGVYPCIVLPIAVVMDSG
jgi:hypothetical protein